MPEPATPEPADATARLGVGMAVSAIAADETSAADPHCAAGTPAVPGDGRVHGGRLPRRRHPTDAEIRARFGPQVAELVRRDREQNVRRAFQSFPLHELPLAARTINPATLTKPTWRGPGPPPAFPPGSRRGKPSGSASGASSGSFTRSSILRSTGHSPSRRTPTGPPCAIPPYANLCSWARSGCGPASMWNIWGCPPHRPAGHRRQSLMETDLDYIGATRQDRIIAEQVRRSIKQRLEWVARWLDQFGWTFDELPNYLAREIPFLANRGGEALRALVAACVLDHDDIATLALSIEGLKRVLAHAADPGRTPANSRQGSPIPS